MNMPSSVTSSKASPLILRMAAKGQESEVAVSIRQEGPGPICRARERTKTDLKQDLGPHRHEAVDDSEGKDERHRVDVETQEPSATQE